MSAAPQARAFGKYEILEQIAAGDTSEIFKARLSGIGGFQRHLAIKRVRPHLNGSTEFINELTNEARLAGLLSHANIVQIIDLGQVDSMWFVAMEYVSGPDLRRVLDRCNKKGITLPVPHAVFACIELLKGLEYAHNRQIMRGGRLVPLNIVHRNLCPEKILVSRQGEVKLADFVGVGRDGHPDYRAPEQVHGNATPMTDLFAAGQMLYEMLTGQCPGKNPKPASHINPDIPYQLEVILERAIQPDPARRFSSATTLKEALDSFFHEAGFIFSHSTLAAFLRSLFPEGQPAPSLSEQETRPLTRAELMEESIDDLPTHIEKAPVDLHKHFPIAESSIRRTQPILGDAPEDETLISRAVDVWSDAQTVIQKDPTRLDGGGEGETTRPTPPEGGIGPAPEIPTASQKAHNPPPAKPRPAPVRVTPPQDLPTGPRTSRRSDRRRRASQRFLILFTALSVVAMVLMLFLGFFIGSRARPAVEAELVPAELVAATPPTRPRIELILPEGATLFLNNIPRPETGAVVLEVEPETLQVLKIEMDGHHPAEVELRLKPAEIRLISFNNVTLLPRRR